MSQLGNRLNFTKLATLNLIKKCQQPLTALVKLTNSNQDCDCDHDPRQ
jgi:hypothetical protein